MKFIELTLASNGKPALINIEKISLVFSSFDSGTVIYINGDDGSEFSESYCSVLKMIKEEK